MNTAALFDLWQAALTTVAIVAAPFLAAALLVGVVTSILQAATQVQENVITFVPKHLATGAVLALMGPWMMDRLSECLRQVIDAVTRLGMGGGA